ncbi:MAG: RnfH family protein [Candidatus Portiera sp.]|nr:RnfH family protein [Portiera sp.]
MTTDIIKIEVALAFPKEQHLTTVSVPKGMSMRDAIQKSGIFDMFAYVPQDVRELEHGVGIFGKEVKDPEEYELKAGDRIEVYRPLTIDPKQARINRTKKS